MRDLSGGGGVRAPRRGVGGGAGDAAVGGTARGGLRSRFGRGKKGSSSGTERRSEREHHLENARQQAGGEGRSRDGRGVGGNREDVAEDGSGGVPLAWVSFPAPITKIGTKMRTCYA